MRGGPRVWIAGGLAVLLLVGSAAWAANGSAILLDLTTASARMFCL